VANSVEKVLAAVGTKFLRAADAFKAVRHGGPRRFEPASFCENFFLAVFSTFSTESALRDILRRRVSLVVVRAKRT
jgi:hypothetical protein